MMVLCKELRASIEADTCTQAGKESHCRNWGNPSMRKRCNYRTGALPDLVLFCSLGSVGISAPGWEIFNRIGLFFLQKWEKGLVKGRPPQLYGFHGFLWLQFLVGSLRCFFHLIWAIGTSQSRLKIWHFIFNLLPKNSCLWSKRPTWGITRLISSMFL